MDKLSVPIRAIGRFVDRITPEPAKHLTFAVTGLMLIVAGLVVRGVTGNYDGEKDF